MIISSTTPSQSTSEHVAVFIDILGSAPIEISEMIVKYFDPLDIIRLERVSKTWMTILRSDQVSSSAFRRLSGRHFRYQRDSQPPSAPVEGWRQLFRRSLCKELGWVKNGPVMKLAVMRKGHDEKYPWLSDLDRAASNYDGIQFTNGHIIIKRTNSLSVLYLPSLAYLCVVPDGVPSQAKLSPNGELLLVRIHSIGLAAFHCRTSTTQYTFSVPFHVEEIACNNNAFAALGESRLSIWNANTGDQIECINLVSLMDESEGNNAVLDTCDMEITADNTIVARLVTTADESPYTHQHIFLISALDSRLRKHISIDYDYCLRFDVGHSERMRVVSTEYGLEIFVLTCDQQDCWTSYDLLTYDADDEDISVSPRNMETGNQFFVGISPTLGCRYPWPVEGKKAGVIEIVEDVGDEMENVNEFAMDGNEKIDYFFADEDWIVVLDERKLNIWGFDEVKCKVLNQSLSL